MNFALRTPEERPLGLDEARRLRGSGWDGDIDDLRSAGSWMILVDTSAWIEFPATAGAPCAPTSTRCFEQTSRSATRSGWRCSPVRAISLISRELRGLLARASLVLTYPIDYEDAAALYRTCRRSGDTVRKLIDCLIAAVAIRADIPVLHADANFDVLARHTPLRADMP